MNILSRCPSLYQIAPSAILLLTAVLELFDTMLEDFVGVEIGTAHGLFFFATAKILKEGAEVSREFSKTRETLGGSRKTDAASSGAG